MGDAQLTEMEKKLRAITGFPDGDFVFDPNVDSAAEIEGVDPFQILLDDSTLPDTGILVSGRATKGYDAVFRLYDYDHISDISVDDLRPKFDDVQLYISFGSKGQSKVLQFAYENKDDPYKRVDPCNRVVGNCNFDATFASLDVLNLSGGGRLLIEKYPRIINSLTTISRRFHRHDKDITNKSLTREILRLFPEGDYQGAVSAVKGVMTNLVGASAVDAELIASQVENKLV